MTPSRPIIGLLLTLIILAGCAPAQGSPLPSGVLVTEADAIEMAGSALTALNDGDYDGWSEHWSDAMKSAIGEDAFLGFRDQVLATNGAYRSIADVTLSSVEPGTYRYTFTVAFERGEAEIAFAFVDGGHLIEGVFVP
jgi:hypothetical protein